MHDMAIKPGSKRQARGGGVALFGAILLIAGLISGGLGEYQAGLVMIFVSLPCIFFGLG
jgi:hypothetical protein